MQPLTEAKAQGWRAIALFQDERGEVLIYLGRSTAQIRAGYVEAYLELFDDEEKSMIQAISMQRWHGAPDAGRWLNQSALKVPQPSKMLNAA